MLFSFLDHICLINKLCHMIRSLVITLTFMPPTVSFREKGIVVKFKINSKASKIKICFFFIQITGLINCSIDK